MEFTYLQFYFIFAVLAIHFLADFIFQTDEEAKNKSKCNIALTSHVYMYSMVTIVLYILFVFWLFPELNVGAENSNVLTVLVLIYIMGTHWGTDYITSRINSWLYKKGKTHLFFISVGFDQLIHFVSLFGIFYVISA